MRFYHTFYVTSLICRVYEYEKEPFRKFSYYLIGKTNISEQQTNQCVVCADTFSLLCRINLILATLLLTTKK